MENKKLFHPSIHVVRVEEIEPEALEWAMVLLHDLGWLTQQGMPDRAVKRVEEFQKERPELFIKACANGFTAIRRMIH